MMIDRVRSRRNRFAGAAISLLVVLGATVASTTSAFATVVPGYHTCANFQDAPTSSGYRAGHCVDYDEFSNSLGLPALRAQGQAFCQSASYPYTIVQCAGISQNILITNLTTGETESSNPTCGSYGFVACPSGRFQNLSPGIYKYCGDHYSVKVRTTIALPKTGDVERSQDLYASQQLTATPRCALGG